jgi:hypothetical protein
MTDAAEHRIHQLVDGVARRLDEWRSHRDAKLAPRDKSCRDFWFVDGSLSDKSVTDDAA